MILFLEDETERLVRFHQVLKAMACELPVRVWRDANAMLLEAGEYLPRATFISLDHDLIQEPGEADLGDGYMVAKWLTAQPIIRPVIIHTSNGERASWMAGEFDLAGWKHYRVPPIGDDWIEFDWRRMAQRILKRQ
jgi:hypothetical protein